MSIYKFYLEIKNRFLLILLCWISTILVSYCFKEVLLFSITIHITSSFYSTEEMFYFIFTDVTEVFSVYMTLIFFLSNQILIGYFLYHLFMFISLGLYKSEYYYLKFIFKISVCVFFFSVIILNQILFPFSWNFFLSFQNVQFITLHFEAKLSEYLTFYVMFYHTCVLYFQTFAFLVLFFDYLKNELKIIKNFRKVFYYSFVIFSTIITPPDVFSQVIISMGIICIYEILMFCVIVKTLIR